MIRILVDAIHMTNNMKGVGLYIKNVLTQLIIMDMRIHFYAVILEHVSTDIFPKNDNLDYISIPWRNHIRHGFYTIPMLSRKFNADIVLVPYEAPLGFISKPVVTVCHDIPKKIRDAQNLKRKHTIANLLRYFDDKLIKRSLRNAEIVFSNSHYIEEWLYNQVGVNPTRIHYAPCAPGADFESLSKNVDVEKIRQKLEAKEGYILTFYTGDPRENFNVIPAVYDRIVNKGLPHRLVIAGVKEPSRLYVEACTSYFSWKNRVRILPFITYEKVQELADIYSAASVYLDLSLQEGFGMQVIEAMACKTPVVCSNRGALPEVVNGAAYVVDPENISDIIDATIKVLSDNHFRNELKLLGYERSKNYSWAYTSKVIYKGLSDIIKKIKSLSA
jgi:glycosyltransferase involved in cell wall biosynthesis